MKRFVALAVLAALTAALIVLPQEALSNSVYAIQVEAGRYYAFRAPFASIGVAAYHERYGSLPVYRWDLNESYYILYAPASGTVYIYPQQVSNSILSTRDWFIPDVLTAVQYSVSIVHYYAYPGGCSVLINAYSESLSTPVLSSSASVNVRFDGQRVYADVSSAVATISFFNSAVSYGGFTPCFPSVSQLNVTAVLLNASISSVSSYYLAIRGFRTCDASTCYDGRLTFGVTSSYWDQVSISSFSTSSPTGYNSTVIVRSLTYTSSSYSVPYTPPVVQHLFNVNLTARVVLSPFTVVLTSVSNGVLTARNGNTIVLASPEPASGVTVTRASITAFATQLKLQTNTTSWIIISLQKPDAVDERFVNPVLVTDRVYAGYYTVVNDTYVMLFKIDGAWSGTAFIAWMFPKTIAQSVRYDAAFNDVSSYITVINGSAVYVPGYLVVENGTVLGFFNYYRLIKLEYNGTAEFTDSVTVSVNNDVYVLTHPRTRITAVEELWISASVLDASPPLPIVLESSIYVNYTEEGTATIAIPLDMLSHVLSTTGTWGYRIPVHVTLGAQPMGLLVLRLELPLGTWVRQGLLSPGLEDLLVVDWENRPVFFHLSYWKTHETAVVYVRLNKPPQSTTFTVYILLYNRALWGTGVSYASIATFDFVNPPTPFAMYGLYNTVTLRPLPRYIKLYTTTADYVVYYLNGTLLECHGAFCTTYQIDPILGGRELVVRASDTVFSVFVDGHPAFSLDVSTLTYYQGVSEAYRTIKFIEYDPVEFAAHYHSVPYTYSLGYLQGGLYVAPRQQPQQQQSPEQPRQSSWGILMEMMPLLVILVILGIVMRFVSQREAPSREVVRLP